MIIFLSELPLFFLLAGKGRSELLLSSAVYVFCCGSLALICRIKKLKNLFGIRYPLLSVILCAAAAASFYLRWSFSERLQVFSDVLRLPANQVCLIFASFLAVLSLPGMDAVLKVLFSLFGKTRDGEANAVSEAFIRVYIFLTALLTITINSKCSPLYPFNDWVDVNTMFTVGKGVLKGYVPYRDLYEQKGPLLLFLHTLGASVSYRSFIGMYIIEILFCFMFLWLMRKTFDLFFGKKMFFMIPVLSFLVYSSHSFASGDTAEEFALPLLGYCLFIGCKAIRNNDIPSGKEFFLIGLSSAAVFWMKYSMIGFYAGWILFFLIFSLRKKKFGELLRGIGLTAAGLIVLSIPVLLYFALNSAVDSLTEAYFFNNIVHYAQSRMPLGRRLFTGFRDMVSFSPAALVCLVLGLIWMVLRRQWRLLLLVILSFAGMFTILYFRGSKHFYYSFICSVFVIFGVWFVTDLLSSFRPEMGQKAMSLSAFSLLLACFGLCVCSGNMYILDYHREDLMQYRMKDIIEDSGIADPTVLNYRILDSGVNTTAGLIPNLRFFCSYNNSMDAIWEEQNSCLKDGCVDFIISYSKNKREYAEFDAYEHMGWFPVPTDGDVISGHYYMKKQDPVRP